MSDNYAPNYIDFEENTFNYQIDNNYGANYNELEENTFNYQIDSGHIVQDGDQFANLNSSLVEGVIDAEDNNIVNDLTAIFENGVNVTSNQLDPDIIWIHDDDHSEIDAFDHIVEDKFAELNNSSANDVPNVVSNAEEITHFVTDAIPSFLTNNSSVQSHEFASLSVHHIVHDKFAAFNNSSVNDCPDITYSEETTHAVTDAIPSFLTNNSSVQSHEFASLSVHHIVHDKFAAFNNSSSYSEEYSEETTHFVTDAIPSFLTNNSSVQSHEFASLSVHHIVHGKFAAFNNSSVNDGPDITYSEEITHFVTDAIPPSLTDNSSIQSHEFASLSGHHIGQDTFAEFNNSSANDGPYVVSNAEEITHFVTDEIPSFSTNNSSLQSDEFASLPDVFWICDDDDPATDTFNHIVQDDELKISELNNSSADGPNVVSNAEEITHFVTNAIPSSLTDNSSVQSHEFAPLPGDHIVQDKFAEFNNSSANDGPDITDAEEITHFVTNAIPSSLTDNSSVQSQEFAPLPGDHIVQDKFAEFNNSSANDGQDITDAEEITHFVTNAIPSSLTDNSSVQSHEFASLPEQNTAEPEQITSPSNSEQLNKLPTNLVPISGISNARPSDGEVIVISDGENDENGNQQAIETSVIRRSRRKSVPPQRYGTNLPAHGNQQIPSPVPVMRRSRKESVSPGKKSPTNGNQQIPSPVPVMRRSRKESVSPGKKSPTNGNQHIPSPVPVMRRSRKESVSPGKKSPTNGNQQIPSPVPAKKRSRKESVSPGKNPPTNGTQQAIETSVIRRSRRKSVPPERYGIDLPAHGNQQETETSNTERVRRRSRQNSVENYEIDPPARGNQQETETSNTERFRRRRSRRKSVPPQWYGIDPPGPARGNQQETETPNTERVRRRSRQNSVENCEIDPQARGNQQETETSNTERFRRRRSRRRSVPPQWYGIDPPAARGNQQETETSNTERFRRRRSRRRSVPPQWYGIDPPARGNQQETRRQRIRRNSREDSPVVPQRRRLQVVQWYQVPSSEAGRMRFSYGWNVPGDIRPEFSTVFDISPERIVTPTIPEMRRSASLEDPEPEVLQPRAHTRRRSRRKSIPKRCCLCGSPPPHAWAVGRRDSGSSPERNQMARDLLNRQSPGPSGIANNGRRDSGSSPEGNQMARDLLRRQTPDRNVNEANRPETLDIERIFSLSDSDPDDMVPKAPTRSSRRKSTPKYCAVCASPPPYSWGRRDSGPSPGRNQMARDLLSRQSPGPSGIANNRRSRSRVRKSHSQVKGDWFSNAKKPLLQAGRKRSRQSSGSSIISISDDE